MLSRLIKLSKLSVLSRLSMLIVLSILIMLSELKSERYNIYVLPCTILKTCP